MFFVVIQLGAILAVCVIFFKKLWPFRKSKREQNEIISLWTKVIVGCIPAGVLDGQTVSIAFNVDDHAYNAAPVVTP